MENLFGGMRTPPSESPTAEVVQGFSGILRRLWHDWSTIPVSDALPRPLYISRLVCASFVKLAGLLKDKTLLDTCREYCDTAGLWLIQDSYPISTAGLQALATEQLHAALMCGTFFERALVDLVVCTTDMNILRGAVDTAILRHARFDPEHAQELLAWATHRGIAPSSKVIVRVGIALARRGDSGHLERYVSHPRLEADERAQVANAYLRMYAMHGRRFMAPRAFAIAAPDMMLLSTEVSDSKLLFKHLWAALLVLLREGHAARAVSLAKDLASRHQSTISGAHYTELLSTLLCHRHFELAHAVLVDRARLQPDSASRWRAMFFHRACTGAPRLAPRLVKVERRIRWRAMPIIRTARSRKAAIVWSLHLPKVYGRASDPATACRAIRFLARLGRIRAAKMLYERICQEESPEVRTAAGNMILHGATQRLDRARSPAQRVRTVAYVYKTLVEKYAFVPDRVTVNILLKMLLLGKQLDAAQTRGLFDAVIRMGYPSGRAVTQDKRGTPKGAFDTSSTESVVVGDVAVPRLATPLMYARHVRPLYKSFIKAFYVLGDAQAARRVVGILKTLETGKASHLAKGQDWVVGGGGGQRQTGA
ncbi:hypothetical protein BN946_scf184945.g59 [Trametes cinnabarina]|uniref:Uncharacterized protein n=1 Tax=Pycnoporus cinnabarinus TaxID=5643 RepID=A0A060SKE5_PYCCI|nr:hypothetical protein BN946_scf184945.g59 [Trametes cinnabarina]